VNRATKDIDLFTEIDDQEALQVTAALREALQQQDLIIRDAERPPADHRFVTVDPASGVECTVAVFPDGGRLHRRVTLDIGPGCLSPSRPARRSLRSRPRSRKRRQNPPLGECGQVRPGRGR